ncbi:MAG: hypothetical protein RBG13Loki_2888 [Promethearchaeota archaeon CR_4]|nr:MAG: hypothetical protein RBG13Loki_2888 [Candidatus Lokiarchaeota archaeon CR_4]
MCCPNLDRLGNFVQKLFYVRYISELTRALFPSYSVEEAREKKHNYGDRL